MGVTSQPFAVIADESEPKLPPLLRVPPHKRKSLTPANLVQTIQTWHSAPRSVPFCFFLISFGREREGQGMLVQGRWRQFEICQGSLPVTRRGRGRPSVTAEKYASISVSLRLKCQHVHQCHKSMCAVVTCTFDDSGMSPFLPRGCLSVMDPRLPTRWTLIRISALTNIFTELQDSCRCPLHY